MATTTTKPRKKRKKNVKMFCPKNSLCVMRMFPYPNTNQQALSRYSLLINDNVGTAKAVSGLKRLSEKESYRGKFAKILIYENTEDDKGTLLAECTNGVWQ